MLHSSGMEGNEGGSSLKLQSKGVTNYFNRRYKTVGINHVLSL